MSDFKYGRPITDRPHGTTTSGDSEKDRDQIPKPGPAWDLLELVGLPA